MPKTQWEDTEALTRFARLIRDYMWNHRPPLNPNSFAELVGVRSSTVAKWRDGAMPDPETMDLIAKRTGMNVLSLYEAAGYVTPRDAWEYISQGVEASRDLDEDTRQRILAHVRELREGYSANGDGIQKPAGEDQCRAQSS